MTNLERNPGDLTAAQEWVSNNLRLCTRAARTVWRTWKQQVPYEDVFSHACEGFFVNALGWRPGRGQTIVGFAYYGAMRWSNQFCKTVILKRNRRREAGVNTWQIPIDRKGKSMDYAGRSDPEWLEAQSLGSLCVKLGMDLLTGADREVFELSTSGMGGPAIALELGVSRQMVNQRLHRCYRRLREQLQSTPEIRDYLENIEQCRRVSREAKTAA